MMTDLEKQKYEAILYKFLYQVLPRLTSPVVEVVLKGYFITPLLQHRNASQYFWASCMKITALVTFQLTM